MTDAGINGLTYAQYDQIIERLSTIDDPELGVNIVDLGLIYDLHNENNLLTLDVTLTYAGCPLSDIIEESIHNCLLGTDFQAKINWVWSPPWDFSRLTEEGREQLRAMGAYL